MEEILRAIDEALERQGLSDAAASKLAVGNPSLIKNLRKRWGDTKPHPIESLQRLASVLGLEFYVGPPRVARRSSPEVTVDGESYSIVRRYLIDLSAGRGIVIDRETSDGGVGFSKAWLQRQGINADLSGIVRVAGDSMEPTIPKGALVLVHRGEMEVRQPGIYAFSRDGEAFVKRLFPADFDRSGRPRNVTVISDNRAYPPVIVAGRELAELRIAGRVRCAIVEF